MSDWIINDILKRSEEAEARKPRINCPTHGNTLICASCRKCLSCIWEEGKASQLRWCLKRRHTFLNLGAPCKYCRGQGGTSAVHTTDESKCSPCWLEIMTRIRNKGRKRRAAMCRSTLVCRLSMMTTISPTMMVRTKMTVFNCHNHTSFAVRDHEVGRPRKVSGAQTDKPCCKIVPCKRLIRMIINT